MNTKFLMIVGAFFVELYLEGLIDFQAKNSNVNVIGKSIPLSKVYKDIYYYPWYFNEDRLKTQGNTINHHNYKKKISNNLVAQSVYNKYTIKAEFLKIFDTKYDDGNYQSGKIRSSCGSSGYGGYSYDSAIANKKNCAFTIIEFEL